MLHACSSAFSSVVSQSLSKSNYLRISQVQKLFYSCVFRSALENTATPYCWHVPVEELSESEPAMEDSESERLADLAELERIEEQSRKSRIHDHESKVAGHSDDEDDVRQSQSPYWGDGLGLSSQAWRDMLPLEDRLLLAGRTHGTDVPPTYLLQRTGPILSRGPHDEAKLITPEQRSRAEEQRQIDLRERRLRDLMRRDGEESETEDEAPHVRTSRPQSSTDLPIHTDQTQEQLTNRPWNNTEAELPQTEFNETQFQTWVQDNYIYVAMRTLNGKLISHYGATMGDTVQGMINHVSFDIETPGSKVEIMGENGPVDPNAFITNEFRNMQDVQVIISRVPPGSPHDCCPRSGRRVTDAAHWPEPRDPETKAWLLNLVSNEPPRDYPSW